MIGLFSSSKLITNPNPGTSSFPLGVDNGCGVVVVVAADWAGAAVAVLVWELSVFVSTFASTVVVGTIVSNGATGIGTSWTGCCCMVVGLIGLTGETGLATFVTFVKDLTHVFCVSTQAPKIGWL